ncbi:hypothetical protein GCM10023235_12750 [Kitasatospora terrestris]|uniref:Uncharacterized protein n=1 Tax=Kitasatospora terrestris TaxID=258051 RepID=A0ABP9DD59_9ACTN
MIEGVTDDGTTPVWGGGGAQTWSVTVFADPLPEHLVSDYVSPTPENDSPPGQPKVSTPPEAPRGTSGTCCPYRRESQRGTTGICRTILAFDPHGRVAPK